jgi:predicted RNA-binding Zn-ribbon protein involved in translation (DUF1610 family)
MSADTRPYRCPRCGFQVAEPHVIMNIKGTGYRTDCQKCGAEIISDDLANFLRMESK